MLRRMIFFFLAAALLSLPCLAADTAAMPVLDEAELDSLMEPFVEKYALNEKNFGLAFLYTGTNESYFKNGDTLIYAASLFKVPLCMLIAEKVSSGELRQEDTFNDIPITRIEEACIIRSSNSMAAAAYSGFIPYADELLTKYSGFDVKDLPQEYRDQYYSPRFMLNTLQTLYEAPERFPNIIECMLQTQPDNYFRQTLEGRFDVAQKYGQYRGVLNNAGIIYTPTPIILVVMTDYVDGNMELIGEMAELFSNYSLTLDERIQNREAERLAAEEAARQMQEEEQQRIAAEEAAARAKVEAERLAAEEARAAAEETRMAEARLAEMQRLAAVEKRNGKILLAATSVVLLLSLLSFYLLKRKR